MLPIKEIMNELGGSGSLTLGAILSICVYVGARQYVDSVETRLSDLGRKVEELQQEQHVDNLARGQNGTLGNIETRLERLEERLMGRK